MRQGDYTILENSRIASRIWRMTLSGDTEGILRGGQFVDVEVDGCFLRRPFAVTDWTKDTLSLIYKVVGQGTEIMSQWREGSSVNLLTGLGNGFDTSLCRKKALVVCGGIGASPAFHLVKELIEEGKEVTVVLGYNNASELILFDEYRKLGAGVRVATMDGSVGIKGLVTDVIDTLDGGYDFFYTCGPKVMMEAVCRKLDISGQVSLEERMGCGCGICYGCTCHTAKGPRRVCADGPVFKKEDIIW